MVQSIFEEGDKMIFRFWQFLFTSAALLLIGCGDATTSDDEGTDQGSISSYGSCSIPSNPNWCQDYIGSDLSDQNQAIQSCAGGIFSTQPCPVENRVGSCSIFNNDPKNYIWRYYNQGNQPHDSQSAQSNCSQTTDGVFSPN